RSSANYPPVGARATARVNYPPVGARATARVMPHQLSTGWCEGDRKGDASSIIHRLVRGRPQGSPPHIHSSPAPTMTATGCYIMHWLAHLNQTYYYYRGRNH